MNRVLKSTLLAASTFMIATTANAADLPNDVLEPIAAPVQAQAFDWSGFYVGANAGIDFNGRFDNNFGADLDKDTGFVGGGVIGYNYQFDKLVLGVEGDINYLTGDATTANASGEVDFISTLTARAGFTPTERLLTYVEGGLAIGRPDLGLDNFYDRDLALGYAVGAGAEYALTDNWISGVE
ncbi:MAG: outer membrane beta-barrel protein, partial [Hyphomicrobiales bacterium]